MSGESRRTPSPNLAAVAAQFPDAEPDEVAAVVAAIGAHRRDREAAAARASAASSGPSWTGRAWSFAGRVERTGGRSIRVRTDAPTDGWAATGRLDRM